VLTLDPALEDGLLGRAAEGAAPRDPRLLDGVLLRLAASAEKMMKSNLTPVVLCTPELRRQLRALCERAAPHLRVISVAEVAPGYELRAFSSITAP
jgi:flagellar biosynthesis protein FlhA